MSLTQSAKEAVYLKNFFKELELKKEIDKIVIYNDNQSAVKLVKNNVYHPRSEHVDIQNHFVQEVYEQEFIYVSATCQL